MAQCLRCHYTASLDYHPETRRIEETNLIRVPSEGQPYHANPACNGSVKLWTGQPQAFRLLPPLHRRSRQPAAA